MAVAIEILTKKDCCLCDEAKDVVSRVIRDYPASLTMVDIESDPQLLAGYALKIPVVMINGQVEFFYKVKEQVLRKKLDLLTGRG